MLNLLVLRARDPSKLARFYELLGMAFVSERHDSGPEHMACQVNGTTLEIYPALPGQSTTSARLGFAVDNVDAAFARIMADHATCVSKPSDCLWGRRAVVRDPEGHVLELTQRQQSETGDLARAA